MDVFYCFYSLVSMIRYLWLGIYNWVSVIVYMWLGICDWISMIEYLCLGICDRTSVIGYLWSGICNRVSVIGYLWSGICDRVSVGVDRQIVWFPRRFIFSGRHVVRTSGSWHGNGSHYEDPKQEVDKLYHVIRTLTAGQLTATGQSNLLFTNYVIAGCIMAIKLAISLMADAQTDRQTDR